MNDEFEKELDKMRNELKKAENKNNELSKANDKLQDEVDSLWAMMDEMTKSDVENWTHLMDQLQKDTVTKALMVSRKKVDA